MVILASLLLRDAGRVTVGNPQHSARPEAIPSEKHHYHIPGLRVLPPSQYKAFGKLAIQNENSCLGPLVVVDCTFTHFKLPVLLSISSWFYFFSLQNTNINNTFKKQKLGETLRFLICS